MDALKEKVKDIVEQYKKDFPEEYALVVEQIKEAREMMKNEWASTRENGSVSTGHALDRAMYRVPITLDNLIIKGIDVDEFYHTSSKEYGHWFTKEFPEFRLTQKI